jgi:hypothetical protein
VTSADNKKIAQTYPERRALQARHESPFFPFVFLSGLSHELVNFVKYTYACTHHNQWPCLGPLNLDYKQIIEIIPPNTSLISSQLPNTTAE